MINLKLLRPSAAIFFLLALLFITYGLERHDTIPLLIAYSLAFAIYLWIAVKENSSVRYWFVVGIVARLVLIPSMPTLSDDVYRFIWDGRLWNWGIHPFAHVPSYYIATAHPVADPLLFEKLNSPDYFTIYPSFPQFIFWISAWLFPKSITGTVIIIRITTLVAEFGIIRLIQVLLTSFHLPRHRQLWYILNPLVILELAGNLHHEVWVLLFMLGIVYFLNRNNVYASAVSFAFAIASKLVPLIALPLLFFRLGPRSGIRYVVATLVVATLLFLPLLNAEFLAGMGESLSYYYRKFEFNASLYYIWREWGFYYYGHNILGNIGWRLAAFGTLGILAYSYLTSRSSFRSEPDPTAIGNAPLFEGFMFVFLIYLLSVTTLHPWYIVPILGFSIFTTYRFVVCWTYLIFLTYSGYTPLGFRENLYLTAFEYVGVFGFLFVELYRKYTHKNT